MIDNFEQISDLLDFKSEDEFYFLQIIQRKKDNPGVKGTNNNSRVTKTYYIKSKNHLDKIRDEVIGICNMFNARAGINLNKRSFKKCALQTARLILDQMANTDYQHAQNAFNSICGRYASDNDKKWILDYDDGDLPIDVKEEIEGRLDCCQPYGNKVITYITTKNGIHIITKPFNILEAKDLLTDYQLDIHKNNPTILYIP